MKIKLENCFNFRPGNLWSHNNKNLQNSKLKVKIPSKQVLYNCYMEIEVGGCGDRKVCLAMGDNESDDGSDDGANNSCGGLMKCLEWFLIVFLLTLAIVLLVKSGRAITLYDQVVTGIANFFQRIADGVKSVKPAASSVTTLHDQ